MQIQHSAWSSGVELAFCSHQSHVSFRKQTVAEKNETSERPWLIWTWFFNKFTCAIILVDTCKCVYKKLQLFICTYLCQIYRCVYSNYVCTGCMTAYQTCHKMRPRICSSLECPQWVVTGHLCSLMDLSALYRHTLHSLFALIPSLPLSYLPKP